MIRLTNVEEPQPMYGNAPRNPEPPGLFLMVDSLEVGGSERQFSLLARHINRENFQLHLGCLQRRGSFLGAVGSIAEFNPGGSLFRLPSLRARIALAHHLRAKRIAVAHSFDFYSNLMLIPAARLAGVAAVIGSHRQIGDLLSPVQFGVQAAAFHLCDRVVCNSRAAARRLADQGVPEEKLRVIPNGLPEEAFATAGPALPRTPDRFRVGMIARMNASYKNHSLFLRAAARLVRKLPGVEFLLAGDGPLRADLERSSKTLGLGDRVRFLGEQKDILAILAAIDVSVVPSVSESSSNVILESMAAGVPVIATRVGGNAESVLEGETGFLVSPDDEHQLAETLEILLTQASLREDFGRRARRLALTNFRMEKIRDKYEELYRELLETKASSQTAASVLHRTSMRFAASRNWGALRSGSPISRA